MNLNQVTVPSLNVEKATEFYKMLGLKLIVNAIPKYVRFECPDGESTFSIHKVDSLTNNSGISIYFEDDNLDVLVEKLKSEAKVI